MAFLDNMGKDKGLLEMRREKNAMSDVEKKKMQALHEKFVKMDKLPPEVEAAYKRNLAGIKKNIGKIPAAFVNGNKPELNDDPKDGIKKLYKFGAANA